MARDYTDLVAWREALALAAAVQRVTSGSCWRGDASLADQMNRAAASIAANIAEGYGRGIGRDCIRFLRLARGSAAELESHLRIARSCGLAEAAELESLLDHCRRVRYLVHRLAESSRTSA